MMVGQVGAGGEATAGAAGRQRLAAVGRGRRNRSLQSLGTVELNRM